MKMRLEDKIGKLIWHSVVNGINKAKKQPELTAIEIADELLAAWTIIDATMPDD